MIDTAQVANLVGCYLAKGGRKVNPWFTKRMKDVPIEVRDAVWNEIQAKGLKPSREGAEKVAPVRIAKQAMHEEDWDVLAEKVFHGMFRHPTKSIAMLANGLMAQVPVEKRKRISGLNIEPLISRIKARFDTLLAQEKELAQVRVELEVAQAVPTKDEVLSALTDFEVLKLKHRLFGLLTPHEVISRYSEDVLLEEIPTPVLVGQAVQRTLETVQCLGDDFLAALSALRDDQKRKPAAAVEPKRTNGHVNGHAHPATPATPRLPKVALIGLKPNQYQVVSERLAGKAQCQYVERDIRTGETIPNNCSIIVIWTHHAMHSTTEHARAQCEKNGTELILHAGGTKKLVQKLEAVLK